MRRNAFDDYELGKKKSTPNAQILNELFKDANLGESGICTVKFRNEKLSFPSKICNGIINVKSFECDPDVDDNCEI